MGSTYMLNWFLSKIIPFLKFHDVWQGQGFFLFATIPDRFWGPLSLLFNEYRVFFPRR